jgi:hypothetical protein
MTSALAAHWNEALDGYRVYRKGPGEDEFTLLPGTATSLTLRRSDRDAAPGSLASAWPVTYTFSDTLPAATAGRYTYYVAGYNAQTAGEAAPSAKISVDVHAGELNLLPEAELTADPPTGVTPHVVTLDAAASHDVDGTLVGYRWDFDNDGVFDLETPGPQAQTTYFEPGTHTARVEVRDDGGATSSSTVALAIADSAWVRTWSSGNLTGAEAMAADAHGNVYVISRNEVTATGGGGTSFTKYAPDGQPLWNRIFSRGELGGNCIAVLPNGDLLAALLWGTTQQIAPGSATSFTDIVLLRIAADDGALRWSKSYDISDFDGLRSLHVSPAGAIYALGGTAEFVSQFEWPGYPFVLRLSAEGEPMWIKRVGSASWTEEERFKPADAAIGQDGNLVLLSSARATQSFSNYDSIALSSIAPTGDLAWSRLGMLTASTRIEARAVAVGTDGGIYVATDPVQIYRYSANGEFDWAKAVDMGWMQSGDLAPFGAGVALLFDDARIASDQYTHSNLFALKPDGNVLWASGSELRSFFKQLLVVKNRLYVTMAQAYDTQLPWNFYAPRTLPIDHLLLMPTDDLVLTDAAMPQPVDHVGTWQDVPLTVADAASAGEPLFLWANPQGSTYDVP